MRKKIEFRFLGVNEFVPAVPARDLLEGEANERGILELVELSPLYERVEEEPENKDKEK